MSRIGDYGNRTALTSFADDEIETLLGTGETSNPGLSDLKSFVTAFREANLIEPSAAHVERVARGAAAVARSKAATVRTASRRKSTRAAMAGLRTYSAAAVATLVLVGVSGMGLVANAAVPGDSLHGLDLAMEKFGIGAGSMEERVSEAQVLAERGEHDEAVAHLTASIADGGEAATGEELEAAMEILAEYTEKMEVGGPQNPDTPGADPTNKNTGPGNNNSGGNETNENTGPGNNNSGGNNETNGPGNNNSGNNETNENTGPGNNNSGGNGKGGGN